jgi:hypothetical protein
MASGLLRVSAGESRLNGVLLAREGEDEPFGKATSFLANRGLGDGDRITVAGKDGNIDSVPVFFITNASLGAGVLSSANASVMKFTPERKLTARKAAKKRPAAKKSSKAKAANKTSAKKRRAAGKKSNQ